MTMISLYITSIVSGASIEHLWDVVDSHHGHAAEKSAYLKISEECFFVVPQKIKAFLKTKLG